MWGKRQREVVVIHRRDSDGPVYKNKEENIHSYMGLR